MAGLAAEHALLGTQTRPLGDFSIAERAAQQDSVIASWQLKALGYSNKAIAYRLRKGRLHPTFLPKVYAVGQLTLTPRGRLQAAVLAHGPTAMLSHRSAAAFWGLRPTNQRDIDVMVPGSSRHRRPRTTLHRVRTLGRSEQTVHDGIPITSVSRTLLDLAAVLPPQSLRRAVEAADRLELLDLKSLQTILDGNPSHSGRRGLSELLTDLNDAPLTRSELERQFLELIREAGLPEPAANVSVAGFEVDFHWPPQGLVVELDGYAFHRGRAAFERDRRRDAALLRADQRVLRITQRRLEPSARDQVIDDIETLLAARAAQGEPAPAEAPARPPPASPPAARPRP